MYTAGSELRDCRTVNPSGERLQFGGVVPGHFSAKAREKLASVQR
jgi:hypothetical protein